MSYEDDGDYGDASAEGVVESEYAEVGGEGAAGGYDDMEDYDGVADGGVGVEGVEGVGEDEEYDPDAGYGAGDMMDEDELDPLEEDISQEDAWVVISAYFSEKGLVRQQLDSFDEVGEERRRQLYVVCCCCCEGFLFSAAACSIRVSESVLRRMDEMSTLFLKARGSRGFVQPVCISDRSALWHAVISHI